MTLSGFWSWSATGWLCDRQQGPIPFWASISSLVLHGGSAGGLPLGPLAVKFHELLPSSRAPLLELLFASTLLFLGKLKDRADGGSRPGRSWPHCTLIRVRSRSDGERRKDSGTLFPSSPALPSPPSFLLQVEVRTHQGK